jgi:hypothetical protein
MDWDLRHEESGWCGVELVPPLIGGLVSERRRNLLEHKLTIL